MTNKKLSRREKLKLSYTDDDKIICKICGEKFIQIGHKHLATHGITPKEYKEKFNVTSLISEMAQKKKLNAIVETDKIISRTAWNKGLQRSDEQKQKQSNTMKEKYASGELMHWNVGNEWSEDVKNQISDSLKNHKYFDNVALEKRNHTIQKKIENGWSSPLKGRTTSEEMRKILIEASKKNNLSKIENAMINIKLLCQNNNLVILNIEHNYYFQLQCTICKTIFDNTRQVFIQSKNFGNQLCPSCFPKNKIVSAKEREISNFVSTLCDNIINNDRKTLSGKEIDILIPDKNLGIEFAGLYWHSSNKLDKDHHMLYKTQFAYKRGIELITIFENEWDNKKEIVKSRIINKLNKSDRIYARLCKIIPVDNKTMKKFLEKTHVQGNVNASVKYGLEYNGELVALMSFGKPRYNSEYEWELLRYSSELYTTVIGGASKLLKHFIKHHSPTSIISYADRRWSNGNLYKQLNFSFLKASPPNYFYLKPNETILYTRIQFQKHKLKHLLKIYDEKISESENMFNNGYRKIWDCGNTVWGWKSNRP